MATMGLQVSLALPALKVQSARLVLKVLLVPKVFRVSEVQPGRLEPMDTTVLQGVKVPLVPKVVQAQLVFQAQLVLLAL